MKKKNMNFSTINQSDWEPHKEEPIDTSVSMKLYQVKKQSQTKHISSGVHEPFSLELIIPSLVVLWMQQRIYHYKEQRLQMYK